MRSVWIAVPMIAVWACGPSYGGQDVKTSDEWIAEQEQIAMEEEQRRKERGDTEDYSDLETDEEKREKFDRNHAEKELKRATRSAESCPGVVKDQEGDDAPRGSANVSITFQEDGTVSSVALSSPFDDTPVGNCIVNAYESVKVPPYAGGNQIIDWELEVKDAKEEKKKK